MNPALLSSQRLRVDFDHDEVIVLATSDAAKVPVISFFPRPAHATVAVRAVIHERHIGMHVEARGLNEGRERFQVLVPRQDREQVDVSLEGPTVVNVLKFGADKHAEMDTFVDVDRMLFVTLRIDPRPTVGLKKVYLLVWGRLQLRLSDLHGGHESKAIIPKHKNRGAADPIGIVKIVLEPAD
jgi:hypothetical protein